MDIHGHTCTCIIQAHPCFPNANVHSCALRNSPREAVARWGTTVEGPSLPISLQLLLCLHICIVPSRYLVYRPIINPANHSGLLDVNFIFWWLKQSTLNCHLISTLIPAFSVLSEKMNWCRKRSTNTGPSMNLQLISRIVLIISQCGNTVRTIITYCALRIHCQCTV